MAALAFSPNWGDKTFKLNWGEHKVTGKGASEPGPVRASSLSRNKTTAVLLLRANAHHTTLRRCTARDTAVSKLLKGQRGGRARGKLSWA